MAVVSPPLPGRARTRRIIPGFGLSLGYTLLWLGLIVLIPLVGVFLGAVLLNETLTWNQPVGGIVILLGAAIAQGRFNGLVRKK